MRAKQLQLKLPNTHGGARKGAGRPNLSGLQAHVRRPRLESRHPVHVTLKLRSGLPSLRGKAAFRCLREAVKTARKQGLHVVHFAVLSNHIHLILEPRQHATLGGVFQSLGISFSKRLNAFLKRSGAVFADRYHLRVLRTPRETRNAIHYVLANFGKHTGTNVIRMDPFSSAFQFQGWRKLRAGPLVFETTAWSEQGLEVWLREILSSPKTWLLRTGWEKSSTT
ncbi:hypothetical protein K2X30_11085 [bacterium]|nr:hypothetical protein [bacterium]